MMSWTANIWMTNTPSDKAHDLVAKYEERDPEHKFSIGDPKETEDYSMQQLKESGYVGIYKQQPLSNEDFLNELLAYEKNENKVEYSDVNGHWMTNIPKKEARDLIIKYQNDNPGYGFSIGNPKGTERYSVEQLKKDGLVGIYKQTLKNILRDLGKALEEKKMVRFFDIVWDIDGEDVELPNNCVLALDKDVDIDQEGADELSDVYGWCVLSMNYEVISPEDYKF